MKNWRQLTIALAALAASAAAAAPVPIRWTVETSRVAPAAIDAYHGETLRLEATLQSYGKPLATAGETPCIYWQTNGMGTAYWSAPATCSNNVLRADFTPEMDPGSAVVHGFIGLPGEIYRASFTLRFRASPGATPNVLPLPTPTLDFAAVEVLNPPWPEEIEAVARGVASNELAIASVARGVASNELEIASVARGVASKLDAEEYTPTRVIPVGLYRLESVDDDPSAVDADNLVLEGIGTYVRPRSKFEISEDSVGFIIKAVLAPARYFGYGNLSTDEYADSTGVPIRFAIGDIISIQDSLGFPDYMCMASNVVQELPPVLMTLGQSISNVVTKAYVEDLGISADFSTNNTELVDTIAATSPAPGDYSTVSNKAMTALQSFTETDPTVSSWAKAATKPSYSWNEIGSKPSFATVATSGSYNDLSNKPTIPTVPTAQINAATTTNALQDAELESHASQLTQLSQSLDGKLDKSGGVITGSIYKAGRLGYSEDVRIGATLDDGRQAIQVGNMSLTGSGFNWSPAGGGDFDYSLPYNGGTIALTSDITPANYSTSNTELVNTIKATAPAPGDYSTVSNRAMTALQSYTESDPTVKSWAKAATKPTYTASEVGAATTEDVYRLITGTNVVLVITNYNSAVHAPSMKLQHLDPDTNEYVTYWDETRRHGLTLTNAMDYADAAAAAEVTRADEAYAPRAWSRTTSGLGVDAPDGVTWISTPETVIAGGYEYEKVITTAGAVWVLTSNGMTAGATTNSFFRVTANDGTELFSIEKTDSYLVGVNATGITKSGNTVTIPVNVVASSHPYIRATTNLVNAVWTKEDENGFSCPWATVSWSGSSGAYVATVTCSQPESFFYFEFEREGTAKIKQSAATELFGGIIFNGTTYMPTVNGNKLEFIAQ